MAILILTDGSQREVAPKQGRAFSLDELQAFVGGDIELVRLANGQNMIVDEEGKFHGRPRNERATLLLSAAGGIPGDYVQGDVLLCSDKEME